MLGIIVYLNEHNIEITGIIEPKPKLDIVNQSSRCSFTSEFYLMEKAKGIKYLYA